MNTSSSFHRAARAAAVAACLFSAQAIAGHMPGLSHLPACHSQIEADATCRLPVKNGSFTSLDGWEALGGISLGGDGNTSYISMAYGSSIQQPVYAMFYKWSGATYALSFRVRAESRDANLDASLYMSDDTGRYTQYIGSVQTTAALGEWRNVVVAANGKPFPAPAHVLIKISNTDPGSAIQVTDVMLVESADAEAVDLR